METKRNLKYYIAPPVSVVSIIGWAVTAVMLMLAFFSATRMLGIVGVIVGLGIVVFSSGGKSNDTDIEYQARERTKNLRESSMKKFDVYEKNFLKMLKPIDLTGYDFEPKEKEIYYKKGQDGTPRTNYFAANNLIFTGEKVYIYGKRISLIDEEIDETTYSSYKYNELERAEILEKKFAPQKGEPVTYYVFKLIKKDGGDALSMCIDYGADSDKAVENINRAISVRSAELDKKAQERARKLAEFRENVMAGKVELPEEDDLI